MNKVFKDVYDLNKAFGREQLEPLESLTSQSQQEVLLSQLEQIDEERREMSEAIEEGDWEKLKDGVIDVLVTTIGMGYVMNIDCEKGLKEVNQSNLSKICDSKQDAIETLDEYAHQGVVAEVLPVNNANGKFIVKSSKNQYDRKGKYYPKGKFLKNINWREPDLSFIELP